MTHDDIGDDILIDADGHIRFVYSDLLDAAFGEDERVTVRASHVEPHPNGPGWLADMRPSGGPILGANGAADPTLGETGCMLVGFKTREAALRAEREWLRKEKGL